jgi:hypothetical protein
VIKIQEKVIQLREVEIIEYTPQAILKKVLSNIPKNYGSEPIILTGFLRTKKMVNDTLAEFSEAIIEDYKSGYYLYPNRQAYKKARSTDIPNFIKGRVIADTLSLNELIGTGDYAYPVGTYFVDFLECYHGQFFDPTEFKMYTYVLSKEIDQDGNSTFKITFDQKVGTKGMLHKGEVYIDPIDFAIKKIFVTYSPNGFDWYNSRYGAIPRTIWKMNGWTCSAPILQTAFTYCKKNDIWILQSNVSKWEIKYSHPLSKKDFRYGYEQALVIMDYTRSPEKIESFKGNKQLGVNENWEKIIGQADETFWNNFNYIPIEESLQQAISNMPSVR